MIKLLITIGWIEIYGHYGQYNIVNIYGGNMDDQYKEVYFCDYCKTCAHEKEPAREDPCNECLTYPVNLYSHKPVRWEEK